MSQTTTAELSDEELGAFTALLDEIIPPHPERRLPGAGESGLAGEIDAQVPELRSTLRQGLSALEEKARARGAARFAELAQPDRVAALTELLQDDPGFLPGIVFHTYVHYYQQARVLEGLGLEARPPFPQGYEMEPLAPERLAGVRSRPRLYRDC